MKGDRICAECEKSYSLIFKNGMSKYCSEECVREVRLRAQKKNRDQRKETALMNSDYNAKLVFDRYRIRSPKRGLVFELTLEDFKIASKKPCYYCNEKYDSIGFDRLDSEIGYTVENSVPCCAMCNMMKRKYDINDFIYKCKNIAANL